MIFKSITAYSFTLPFRTPVTLSGVVHTYSKGLLLAMETERGQTVWTEASPLPGFSIESMDKAAEEARNMAVYLGKISRQHSLSSFLLPQCVSPAVHFAYWSALQTLSAGEQGLSLHRYLNPGAVDRLPLCVLIDGSLEGKRAQIRQAVQRGYGTVKLKVGRSDMEEDIMLVHEILREWGSEISLRLDANRAWNKVEAFQFCRSVPVDRICFLEEPTRDFRDLPHIQEHSGMACAADETLQTLSRHVAQPCSVETLGEKDDLLAVAEQARFMVWKPSLCLPVAMMGIQSRAPIILSAAYESGVGTSLILAYASALSGNDCAPGVDTYTRLALDVLESPLPLDKPEADLVHCEGLCASVNPSQIQVLWHV